MPGDSIRFLIVDDVEENLIALEALLRRDGLVIDRAKSASEALELLLNRDYALVLLDVHMPETDGYELAELMRGTQRSRSVPIIFVTAAEKDETRRFRGYEAGAVDFIFKPIDPVILSSKVDVFFRIGMQARELERQRDEMRDLVDHRDRALARLRAHTDNSPLGFVEFDCGFTIRSWSQGAERLFARNADEMIGRRIDETGWLPDESLAILHGWVQTDAPVEAEFRASTELLALTSAGQEVACEVYGSLLVEPGGKHRSLSLQILDISERRQAEEVRSLLIGELNHRIKNTLANVQAIARQTLRQSTDLKGFDVSFSGRLQALARAHTILSEATWASAPLGELIDSQIEAGTLFADRLECSGPNVQISPENVLKLALAFHELATNAQKYGSLSTEKGEVHLDWKMEGEGLVLRWKEVGGPPVNAPSREGFGLRLLSSAAGDGSRVDVDWHKDGVVWTIHLAGGVSLLGASGSEPLLPAETAAPVSDGISGLRVLIVEDEVLVALDLSQELETLGADVVGVATTLADAQSAARRTDIDLAILDGNLRGERVDTVADMLTERGVPFFFLSGYGSEHLPAQFRTLPVVQKPFSSKVLRSTLLRVLLPREILPA